MATTSRWWVQAWVMAGGVWARALASDTYQEDRHSCRHDNRHTFHMIIDVLNVDPEQLPKVMQSLQSTPELELRAAWVPFELLGQSALKVAVMTGPVCGIAMTAAIRAAYV